jgi:hypothetical protein
VDGVATPVQHGQPRWVAAGFGRRSGGWSSAESGPCSRATGIIRVERGWDQVEGEVPPKSKQGWRKVPIAAALRDRLAEYLIDGPASCRIFVGIRDSYDRGRAAAEASEGGPADTAWVPARVRGADDRRRSECQGALHAHGPREHPDHARPVRPPAAGAEDEAAGLPDAFLARQSGGAQVEQPAPSGSWHERGPGRTRTWRTSKNEGERPERRPSAGAFSWASIVSPFRPCLTCGRLICLGGSRRPQRPYPQPL